MTSGAPLAPWEPDGAEDGELLPLELLALGADGLAVGVRVTADEVLLRTGRGPRRPVRVRGATLWARAGRLTLRLDGEPDLEVRLLAPEEYDGVSVGHPVEASVLGAPGRAARSARLSGRRDAVRHVLVARLHRVAPGLQVGTA